MSNVICTFLWLYPESAFFALIFLQNYFWRFFSLLNALIDIHDYNEPLQMCTRWNKKGKVKIRIIDYIVSWKCLRRIHPFIPFVFFQLFINLTLNFVGIKPS